MASFGLFGMFVFTTKPRIWLKVSEDCTPYPFRDYCLTYFSNAPHG